jgi:hypothetical protein
MYGIFSHSVSFIFKLVRNIISAMNNSFCHSEVFSFIFRQVKTSKSAVICATVILPAGTLHVCSETQTQNQMLGKTE